MFLTRSFSAVLLLVLAWAAVAADAPRGLTLDSNDVVAFVGGSDVAAAQFTGHLEALLAVKFPGARYRNFGWEGDTVFARPREIGFPPLAEQLKRAGVTVLFLEFGRAEALSGKKSAPEFLAAYEKLVDECTSQTPRLMLITPPPFESAPEPLPDLAVRNQQLAAHAAAIHVLARRRGLPLVDLFSEFGDASHAGPRLTDNGLQLSPRGQALVAAGCVQQLGFGEVAAHAGDINGSGGWSNPGFERLRQVVIGKNQLWFNYWRPQNWAFLGGDRVTQPSSRDHRDPKVRWFPAEMEKYGPLIREKESEVEQAAIPLRESK